MERELGESKLPGGTVSAHGRSRGMRVSLAAVLTALTVSTAPALGQDESPQPTITGEARVGETLTGGSTTGEAFDQFWWQACDPAAQPCDATAPKGAPEWTELSKGDAGASTYTLVDADAGHIVRLLAKFNRTGSQWSSSDPVGPVAAAEPEPTPPGSTPPSSPESPPPSGSTPQQRDGEELPPPTAHETANAEPVKGTVMVKEPGGRFRELTDPEQVALGAIFDTTAGRVSLVTARNEKGKVQGIELWAGRFVLDQTGGKRPITEAKLTGRGGRVSSGLERRAARRKKGGRLWGKGKCRCRTRGKRGSGTVRGTQWLTVESRRGTRFKVKEGRVEVRDFARKRSVMVGAGESYLAKKKKRR